MARWPQWTPIHTGRRQLEPGRDYVLSSEVGGNRAGCLTVTAATRTLGVGPCPASCVGQGEARQRVALAPWEDEPL